MNWQMCEEIINLVSGLYRDIVLLLLLIGLWRVLFGRRLDKKAVILFGILAAAEFFMDYALNIHGILRYLIYMIVLAGYCRIRKISSWEKPVFLILFLYHLHTMSVLISICVYQAATEKWQSLLDTSAENFMDRLYFQLSVLQIAYLLLYSLLVYVFFRIFKKIGQAMNEMAVWDLAFLSVLNVVGIILAYMVVHLTVVPLENEVFLLFENRRDSLWKVPAMAILLLFGEYAGIYVWKQYRTLLIERQRVLAREEQLKQIRQRFEEADSFYGDIRRLRHDMKNHMTNIKGLVASEQYEEVEHYIEKLDYSIEKLDCKFSTGNAVCDVVLGDKYKRAVKEGIRMEVDFFYKEDCSIAAFDMGIILANLLDNAIEACCRLNPQKRFIRLHMKKRDRFVFIEVENPFAGEIRIDEKNQLPVTTKYEEGEPAPYLAEHGIGLRNVREIAQQYLGGIRIDAEEQIFRITVMMQQNAG